MLFQIAHQVKPLVLSTLGHGIPHGLPHPPWSHSPSGQTKLNFDAAIRGNFSIGVAVDSNPERSIIFARTALPPGDPILGKASTTLLAISLVCDYQMDNIILE
jgi:hypothetical protein